MFKHLLVICLTLIIVSLQPSYAGTSSHARQQTETDFLIAFTTCLSHFNSPDVAANRLNQDGKKLNSEQIKAFGLNSFTGDAWVVKSSNTNYAIFIRSPRACTVIPDTKPAENFHAEYKNFTKGIVGTYWNENIYTLKQKGSTQTSEVIFQDKDLGQTFVYMASTKSGSHSVLSFNIIKD